MNCSHVKYVILLFVLLTTGLLGTRQGFGQTSDYLSPIYVVADGDGKMLYIAGATANQVAFFDVTSGKINKSIPVGEKPVGLDISANGDMLFVTSAVVTGKVQVIDVRKGIVSGSIAVGHTPVAVVASPDGKRLYVCNQFDNNIGIIDLGLKKQVATIGVVREPVVAAVTSDGRYLFVANHLPAGAANADYIASVVSVIDTTAKKVIKNIELPNGSTNVRDITISPDGRNAYVTHVLARYQFPVTYLEKGWINTNAMTIIDVPRHKYINTVLVDDVEHGAANPYGITCTADGKNILITHMGTYELSVIDRKGLHDRLYPMDSARNFSSEIHSGGGRKLFDESYSAEDIPNDLTFMDGIRRRIKLDGISPRGLAVIGTKVYVAEYYTDSLGVVDIKPDVEQIVQSIPLVERKRASFIRKGEVLFNDASLSFQNWNSCTSCHTGDGRASAMNWDLLNDGVANPKNIRSLLLSHVTPPAMITGVRVDAEQAVRSGIRYIQFASTTERKAQAIDAYLKSLKPIDSPYLVNGKLSEKAERGKKIFDQAGCAVCHSPPLYTNMKKYDMGTSTEEDENQKFDTPTLIEVWRTAPYLHNGSAVTIQEVLRKFKRDGQHGRMKELTEKQIEELAEFVLSL